MPKSSSPPSPTIRPMSPPISIPKTLTLTQPPPSPPPPPPDLFLPSSSSFPSLSMDDDDDSSPHPHHHHHHHQHHHDHDHDAPPPHPQHPFSSLLFDDDHDDDDPDETLIDDHKPSCNPSPAPSMPSVDPTPHISSQFYTFNRDSHALMVRCILESRLATPDEIRGATPRSVLRSWRSVWKDRNEDTAYLTAWKRIQDKLSASPDPSGGGALFFKNNPAQRVSHVEQWHEIVAAAHADPDLLRHLGLKDTVDRIKQSWTVGAKFYGIPESFVRVCVASCPVCTSASSGGAVSPGGSGARTKRRRFEYTETLDVPAKDVPRRLQQLAAKHKVVLCIRQKYIRYKPFMAEVKDYACHRAGEPTSASASSTSGGKKARVLKREPYQSKRCGCGFRIRAIVPITNYNEKDKTFVYQEEGTAVFKLYAVHSGHEPGPLDGNARIVHRLVGHKGALELDPEVYGVSEDNEHVSFASFLGKDDVSDSQNMVLPQIQELRAELGLLEGRVSKMPSDMLGSLSNELLDILHRIKKFSLDGSVHHLEETLAVGDEEVGPWGPEGTHHLDRHDLDRHDRIFSKDDEMIEDEEADLDSGLGHIVQWDRMAAECHDRKIHLIGESLKSDKWMMKEDVGDFDEKSILNCGDDDDVVDSKLIRPLRHDESILADPNLVGMQVDAFYAQKWCDSPSVLPTGDGGDVGFRPV
ncbi:hypothetical protein ACMD2_21692 [Ananas comosus]|uniref:Uncharacterized protein n=1 Tax=Ananas comosus TaxID=4615 RepID=A0A199VIM6_ANACO|nr:hypothetical protein ACMD2_21692 [Ananas comosus]